MDKNKEEMLSLLEPPIDPTPSMELLEDLEDSIEKSILEFLMKSEEWKFWESTPKIWN